MYSLENLNKQYVGTNKSGFKIKYFERVIIKNKTVLLVSSICKCGKEIKVEWYKFNLKKEGICRHYTNNPIIKLLKSRLRGMKKRCKETSKRVNKNYAGRGIKVCKEWVQYSEKFIKWALENGFKPKKQIDRIDNNGDYSPENCRWVTPKENCSNTRINLKYKSETATDASLRLNGSRYLVSKRVAYGWNIKDAFTAPIQPKGKKSLYS